MTTKDEQEMMKKSYALGFDECKHYFQHMLDELDGNSMSEVCNDTSICDNGGTAFDLICHETKNTEKQRPNRISDGFLELEREITCGSYIGWQDQKWHLFYKNGESVNDGRQSLFELVLSLSENQNED
ncbi:hypothetical protein EOL73_00290 [Candidatus Saccharibacteria bacterium]|nr:hypothetical protein [Candidatus Saccharibacteria bacterium]